MSQLQVWLSAEDGKNVSWPWLSPLQGWGSLTMISTSKLVYMAHHFIFLRLNPFGLRIDKEGWWFEHSMSQLRVCLSAEDAKNVSWPGLSPLRGCGSLTMTSTAKFVYIYIYTQIDRYIDRQIDILKSILHKRMMVKIHENLKALTLAS